MSYCHSCILQVEGHCKKFPPRVFQQRVYDRQGDPNGKYTYVTMWPKVKEDDSCDYHRGWE